VVTGKEGIKYTEKDKEKRTRIKGEGLGGLFKSWTRRNQEVYDFANCEEKIVVSICIFIA
jgi:hypothetical protein